MSDLPAVNFEALAQKYKTAESEAVYRADQLENIAATLMEQRDQALEQLKEEKQLNGQLTHQLQKHAEQSSVIPGETVED